MRIGMELSIYNEIKIMKTTSTLALIAAATVWAAATSQASQSPSATQDQITVKIDEPTVAISPKFYGIFFEEISMAGDGGLYAELIRNRNFEDSSKLDHWEERSTGAATAVASLVQDVPTGGFNSQSALLKVDVPEGQKGEGLLINNGYFGISVQKGAAYKLSLFVKGSPGTLKARLVNETGDFLAASKVKVSQDWTKQSLTLRPKSASHYASLQLVLDASGEAYLDMVSLFPKKTWGNRENGLRIDLAKKLEDLNPTFVRFPGGCWVEGDTMATSYRWKETIGKLSERRTQHNLWGYEVGHGLGYHEYLELCEDLGAEALFVINCGMSHKDVVPMEQMDEYVQDALDAIEYANGDTSTRWGAERAKNGHPKPFNLTMLQVGNENGGPAYDERYALFYDAIKEKHPEIKVVACLWGGSPKSRPIEILDEHYYSTPEYFISKFHQYDSYERGGMEIYVGEYAVTQRNGLGALRGALGEAVYMMGMENNADVVTMTSYAPLFVNVNRRSWSPDLINFDNHRSYGTPSYYVQKLFAQHIGSEVVPVEMEVAPLVIDKSTAGGVGLGTWVTQAEFKDMKVTVDGETIYENSGSQVPEWRTNGGSWRVESGALRQTDRSENVFAYLPMELKQYTFNVKARKVSGNEGFLILFNAQDNKNFFWWNIGGWGNTRHAIEVSMDGGKSELGQSVNGNIQTGKWYDIQVDVQANKIICSLDGVKIHEASTITETQSVYASASRNNKELFIKAVNLDKSAREVVFKLDTKRKISSRGTLLTMSHPDEWAENSLTEPERIIPLQKTVKVSKDGVYELPANSVNVFKLTLRGASSVK